MEPALDTHEGFERLLQTMSSKDIRLALATARIGVGWQRSLAKIELWSRREAKRDEAEAVDRQHKRQLLWLGVAGTRGEVTAATPSQYGESTNRELLEFLRHWLAHHILKIDMAYRPFVENRPEARKAAKSFKAAEVWWSQ